MKNQPDLAKRLSKRLQQALEAIDPANYQSQRGQLADRLGFRFGLPSVVSAGLGALQAAADLPPALETKLKRLLLQSQQHGYWVSTYDTAQVIFNTRELLSKEAAAAQSQKPEP